MARIYAFPTSTDQSCQEEFKLRSEALAPLQKKGLQHFAESAYQRLLLNPRVSKIHELSFPIVKDAYLYTFCDMTNIFSEINDKTSPNTTENFIIDTAIPHIRNLKAYGEDYFRNNNMSAELSDSLYAVAIMRKSMDAPNLEDTYISIIGEKAYEIHTAQTKIEQDSFEFFKTDTPEESKLLHLAIKKLQSATILKKLDENTFKPDDIQSASKFCDQITELFLTSGRSDIEDIIKYRTSEIRKILNKLQANTPSVNSTHEP